MKRNSGMGKLFWASLIVLIILGIIVKHLNITQQNYPQETEPSSNEIITETVISPKETLSQENDLQETLIQSQETTSVSFNTEETDEIVFEESENKTQQTENPETIPTVETPTTQKNEAITSNETISFNNISEPSENNKGTIYLTFDDGPSIECTSRILDILKENNIKATFFILDYEFGSEKEDLVIQAFNDEHTIALHGTSHSYSKIYASLDNLIENFETLREKVFTTTGHVSNIIRFPGGSSNTVSKHYCPGIMTAAAEYFSTTDFKYFDWNVDSQDAGKASSPEEVFENVTSSIKSGRNNIVLMHDSSNKTYTVEALQKIIDWALAEGYVFDKITEDTLQVTHRIAN